jgi:hypothetical protein
MRRTDPEPRLWLLRAFCPAPDELARPAAAPGANGLGEVSLAALLGALGLRLVVRPDPDALSRAREKVDTIARSAGYLAKRRTLY